LLSDEVAPEAVEPLPAKTFETLGLGSCPLLGFVDDATRHYSRATAMHRCFAGGRANLVTGETQRELCLSGRYPTCPRFRNAAVLTSATLPPAGAPPSEAEASPPLGAVPPGVAARMAPAGQMRMSSDGAAETALTPVPQADPEPPSSPTDDAEVPRPGRGPRRGLLLVAIGAGLGLVVLVGGLMIAMPALNSGLGQKPSAAAAQPFEPVPIASRVATSVAKPTDAATLAPSPTVLVRATATRPPSPATPTARAAPAVSVAGQPLIDVRFAAGAQQGWLDNPPYAMWSDGAYRLQARQPTHFVAVGAPVDRLLRDVVVSATFRKTGGPPGGGYGLVVRDQSPEDLDGVNQDASAYVLEAGDLGDFGVWRRAGDHWVDLVPWTHSESVRIGGSPNDLVVRAVGDRLTFIVNGTELASVQDNTLPAGGVGVFVGGDYNEVALDRFVVQVPD
jgi:hypothetical protein